MKPVARHRHYLGTWSPEERVRVGSGTEWRAPDERELTELVGDEGLLSALTVPRRIRRALWELDWDEGAEGMTPRDQDAFAAYGRSVMAFLRGAGLVMGAPPPSPQRIRLPAAAGSLVTEGAIKLVASAPGVTLGSEGEGSVVLINVGESECLVTTKAAALHVPPDEGCLVAGAARPWSLVVPAGAEFGLFLEVS